MWSDIFYATSCLFSTTKSYERKILILSFKVHKYFSLLTFVVLNSYVDVKHRTSIFVFYEGMISGSSYITTPTSSIKTQFKISDGYPPGSHLWKYVPALLDSSVGMLTKLFDCGSAVVSKMSLIKLFSGILHPPGLVKISLCFAQQLGGMDTSTDFKPFLCLAILGYNLNLDYAAIALLDADFGPVDNSIQLGAW